MVKKGEYYEFALELEKKTIDFSTNIKTEDLVVNTEMSIILALAKKIEELENRIVELESEKEVVESG